MPSFGRRRLAMVQLQKIFPYSVWFQSHVYGMVSGDFFHCGFSSTVAGSSYTYKKFTPVQFVSGWRNKFVMEVPLHCVRAKADALTLQTSTSQTLCGGQFSYQPGWQNQIICLLKYTPLIDPCLIFSDLSASQLIMVFEELCCSDAILVDSLSNFLKYFL